MVNELRDLLRDNASSPPPVPGDLTGVLAQGRRRVRRRRAAAMGGTALATAALALGTYVVVPNADLAGVVGDRPPVPDAPTLTLADAEDAVEGEDYRVLASYTNENLDRDNGQYLDGVTDDGLLLFRDAPDMEDLTTRLALMDPATGDKEWLPELPGPDHGQVWPVHLGSVQLVLTQMGMESPRGGRLGALVYDRSSQEWRRLEWPDLPRTDQPFGGEVGPDGRLWFPVPATRGRIPEGGWPTGPDGEAEDADAEGDTYDLWSLSLTDPADARDENMRVGDFAFTDDAMVWTDSTNGAAGMVHVRDLATGEEHSFDPEAGEKCNLLDFGAVGDRIMMSQYCGTYSLGVRDDRVQVLSTDGEQVATIQESGVEGTLANTGSPGVVGITAYSEEAGTYAYDLASDRLLRLSDSTAKWSAGRGPVPPGQLMWTTPVNRGHGATQWLGELVG